MQKYEVIKFTSGFKREEPKPLLYYGANKKYAEKIYNECKHGFTDVELWDVKESNGEKIYRKMLECCNGYRKYVKV